MRRFKIMGLTLVAVLAVGAMSASAASAAKAKLVLREGGGHSYEGLDPIVPGAATVEASLEVALGDCAMTPIAAEMADNSSDKDSVDLTTRLHEEHKMNPVGTCLGEYEGKPDTMEIHLSSGLSLYSKGTAKTKAFVGVETQNAFGECGYGFDLKNATFQLPTTGSAGEAVLKGTATGKGAKSNIKACPKKVETAFTMTVADNGGFPLEATLEG